MNNIVSYLRMPPTQRSLQLKEYVAVATIVFVSANVLLYTLRKILKRANIANIASNGRLDKNRNLYKAYEALPGPRPFPIRYIGNLFEFFPFRKAEVLPKLLKISEKYGPCFRLSGLNEDYVFLNSAPYVQALLTSNDSAHLGKGGLEEKLWPEGVHGLVTYTGDEWRARRKMLNRFFTYGSLQRYNACFNKQSGKLIQELEELFKDGDFHDVDHLVQACIFRQSSETLMGVDLSDSEDGLTFCKYTRMALDATFERLYRPWLYPNWIWRLHPLYKEQIRGLCQMGEVTGKVIGIQKEKLRQEKSAALEVGNENANKNLDGTQKDYRNMIEALLDNGVPDQEIFHEVAIMLAVAHDTTSTSVIFALFLLALHPEHQQLCRDEIDAIFDDPQKCANDFLEFETLKEMKYLERCLLEAQRLFPVASVMRKLETPLRLSEELVIPAGVTPCYIGYVFNVNPEYYPDPHKFDPDRFLPDEIRKRHPYAFTPFSGGPRNCIGMKLAMIELKIIFAKILRTFDISTPDKREDVKILLNGIPIPAKPIRFLLKKRNPKQI